MKALEQAKKIYKISVTAAQQGETITYKKILDQLGYGLRVSGHAIRYGLELAWIACSNEGLPSLTAIIVNQSTGAPSEGYSVTDWKRDAEAVFRIKEWPEADSIDWEYIWKNRVALSEKYGTRGYWVKN